MRIMLVTRVQAVQSGCHSHSPRRSRKFVHFQLGWLTCRRSGGDVAGARGTPTTGPGGDGIGRRRRSPTAWTRRRRARPGGPGGGTFPRHRHGRPGRPGAASAAVVDRRLGRGVGQVAVASARPSPRRGGGARRTGPLRSTPRRRRRGVPTGGWPRGACGERAGVSARGTARARCRMTDQRPGASGRDSARRPSRLRPGDGQVPRAAVDPGGYIVGEKTDMATSSWRQSFADSG